jgi:hypothetical protein
MTILKELRDAAMGCTNLEFKRGLLDLANAIQLAIAQLQYNPIEDNMITLNGLWARADWLLKNVPPEAAPTPPRTEELRMAA